MRNERVTFPGANGTQLSARLSLPPDGDVRACALFAHCFTCSKDLKPVVNISRAMTQQRLAVLRFDFTGLGESEGDFAGTTFSSNIEDLVAAAAFMERELSAPAILVGHSLGGAAVLQAAAQLPSVRAVATIGAPFDPAHVKKIHAEDEQRCESEEARLDRLDRELTLTGPLTAEQRQRLMEIADRCPVHRTLSAGVHIVTELSNGDAGV